MTVDISAVEALTRLAEQFGPFLFAILFILVVTRTAQGYYNECNTRKHPPPTEQEKRTYRLYFLCSVWVGIAVMALSIGWWLYAQARGTNVYQVAIVDLAPDEHVLSDYYVKQVDRPTVPGATAAHDSYFLIVRDQPFKVGERFAFDYFKLPSNPGAVGTGISAQRVEIKYNGSRAESFRLVADAGGPRLELLAQSGAPAPAFAASDVERARTRYAVAAAERHGAP